MPELALREWLPASRLREEINEQTVDRLRSRESANV